MQWSARVVDKQPWQQDASGRILNDNVVAVVEFTSDSAPPQVFRREIFGNDLSDAHIAQWAKIVIATRQQADAGFEALSTGAVVPADPPAQTLERRAFDRAYQKLRALRQLAADGVIQPDSPQLTAAVAAARTLYQPRFFE